MRLADGLFCVLGVEVADPEASPRAGVGCDGAGDRRVLIPELPQLLVREYEAEVVLASAQLYYQDRVSLEGREGQAGRSRR